MTAAASDTSRSAATSNEDLVVAIALDVLAAKGWLEDDPDPELLAALHRLYRTQPICRVEVRYTGELMQDMLAERPGVYLAGAFENERQEEWERTLPTWSCDCGQVFKVLAGGLPGKPDDRFYRVLDNGLLGELAGTLRGTGIARSKACPECARGFAATIKRHRPAAAAIRGGLMTRPGNLVTEAELDALKRQGWVERAREPRPSEGRVLVRLWHPCQTLGEGGDRYQTAVETFRSLPLDDPGPAQLALFQQPC
ncbi:MAG: hypothetical protein ACLP01_23880 [Solirubrobacteraceae bacterium]